MFPLLLPMGAARRRFRETAALDMPADAEPRTAHDPPGSIFIRFLKFGALAWGGPAAQISMISRECVEEERWVDEETFKKTLAVYQVLPGPEAHELCVYFGRMRGGRLGALLAGLGFMLPGFLLMFGLSVLYVEAGLDEGFEDLFYGLNAAVPALVAMAIVRLGRKFITDLPLGLLAVGSLIATALLGVTFIFVLLGTGLTYWVWRSGGWTQDAGSFALAPAFWKGLALGAVSLSLVGEIFFEGLKAGLLTFGGAYTVIPWLQESAVETQHWLTQAEFLDGLALGGILPAPVIIFSTFVGYLAGGVWGSLAMTAGIFLPAFVFPIFLHRQLVAVAENPHIRPFLLGVAAGVIGLIAAVTIDIVDAGVVDVPSALIAVGSFAALYRFQAKLTVLWVMLAAGLLGLALQLTVL